MSEQKVQISHPDKVLYPDEGITKKEVLEYYRRIASRMLPWCKGRPLTLRRFPDGISEEGFYQKEAADYFPDWIPQVEVPHKSDDGATRHVICDSEDALAWLANQGTLEFHLALSRADKLAKPDMIIVDLDPPEGDFSQVKEGALLIREALDSLGIPSFIMTTGSSGVHIRIPLQRGPSFEKVLPACKQLAEKITRAHSEIFTTAIRKEKRGGKLFFDIKRNAYGQTGIAPYSLRALPGAPVATPLSWEEFSGNSFDPRAWKLKNIFRRLGQLSEAPWSSWKENMVKLEKLIPD